MEPFKVEIFVLKVYTLMCLTCQQTYKFKAAKANTNISVRSVKCLELLCYYFTLNEVEHYKKAIILQG
jgi:hypothetical protein